MRLKVAKGVAHRRQKHSATSAGPEITGKTILQSGPLVLPAFIKQVPGDMLTEVFRGKNPEKKNATATRKKSQQSMGQKSVWPPANIDDRQKKPEPQCTRYSEQKKVSYETQAIIRHGVPIGPDA